MDSVVEQIVNQKISCYFISPHLDDAIFSAGDLIEFLSHYTEVAVVTIFTDAERSKPTLSARMFLKQCRIKDAQKLFEMRRAEDTKVCNDLGIEPVHLGYSDALWRNKAKRWGGFIPELSAVYPTYKFHVISGKISQGDKKLMEEVENNLTEIIPEQAVIFCPVGVGSHVDHIVTREVCSRLNRTVFYWADFPYDQNSAVDQNFIELKKLKRKTYVNNLSKKSELISGYESQVRAMFPDGLIKLQSETYFLPEELV